jgi:hypothetical protein
MPLQQVIKAQRANIDFPSSALDLFVEMDVVARYKSVPAHELYPILQLR